MNRKILDNFQKSSEDKRINLKKYDDLKKELAKERLRVDDYVKKFQYLQAEFDNYQKRVSKEIKSSIREANEKLILKIITILDELEIVTNAVRKNSDKEVMLEGLDMILNKFKKILIDEGLYTIDAIGKPFDPNLHEAILQVQSNDCPTGIVVEEFKKGYLLNGKLIRPSVVSVSKT